MNHEIAYVRQAYKKHTLSNRALLHQFLKLGSSSDATFCTTRYNRLLVVLYFIFIKKLLFFYKVSPELHTQNIIHIQLRHRMIL